MQTGTSFIAALRQALASSVAFRVAAVAALLAALALAVLGSGTLHRALGPQPDGSADFDLASDGSAPPGDDPGLRDVIGDRRLRAEPPPPSLADKLRRGGYVVAIRHAATDWRKFDDPEPDLDDIRTQRILAETGRRQAVAIGRGFRALDIPVGRVLTSPYFRTRETATLAFPRTPSKLTSDLINESHPGIDVTALGRAVRRLVAKRPAAGTNTVLVSHVHTLHRGTGDAMVEGEAIVYRPRRVRPGHEGFELTGRVRPDGWDELASRAGR